MDETELGADAESDLPRELLYWFNQTLHSDPDEPASVLRNEVEQIATQAILGEAVSDALSALAGSSVQGAGLLALKLVAQVESVEDHDVRVRRWNAVWSLLGDYTVMFADREKLLGHLLLRHRRTSASDLLEMDVDELLALHQAQHEDDPAHTDSA